MKKTIWIYQIPFVVLFAIIHYLNYLDDAGKLQNQTIKQYVLPPFKIMSDKFTDMKFRLRGVEKPKNNIIVVAIDGRSLEQFGRWPWRRDYLAYLIENIYVSGAKAVALDIVFSEPDERVPGEIKDLLESNGLNDLLSRHQTDKILGKTVQRFSNSLVLGWTTDTLCVPAYDIECSKHINHPDFLGSIPPDFKLYQYDEIVTDSNFNPEATTLLSMLAPVPNIPVVRLGATFNGIFNVQQDIDGTVRKYQMGIFLGGKYYPTLAVAMAKAVTKKPLYVKTGSDGLIEEIKLGDRKIEVSPRGEIGINFRGPFHTFKYVSALDLLSEGDELQLLGGSDKTYKKSELFKDALVFIAPEAVGINDLRSFPFEQNIPGVEGHITVLDNLLSDDYLRLRINNKSLIIAILIMVIGGLLYTYLCGTLRPIAAFVLFISVMGSIGLIDLFLLFKNNINWQSAFLFAELNLIYLCSALLRYIADEKDKRFLRKAFSNYISPELVKIMTDGGELPHLGGATRHLTAYFTDIQGFSSFSEELTPDKLVELLNEYLTVMTDTLIESHGTLDKYEGDAIIAFFGAPLYFEDHATKACHTALRMQEELGKLRIKWESEGDKWPGYVKHMRMRIGINTGEILCGNMGSRDRMNYTMMGDDVNLAARLEEAAKQYGVYTHVTEDTVKETGDLFITRELDTIVVVRRTKPVTTYELLGEKDTVSDTDIKLRDLFHKGLDYYKKQQWDEAIKIFEECIPYEHHADPEFKKDNNPSLIYIDRCKSFKENPPPQDWDGIYRLTKK